MCQLYQRLVNNGNKKKERNVGMVSPRKPSSLITTLIHEGTETQRQKAILAQSPTMIHIRTETKNQHSSHTTRPTIISQHISPCFFSESSSIHSRRRVGLVGWVFWGHFFFSMPASMVGRLLCQGSVSIFNLPLEETLSLYV